MLTLQIDIPVVDNNHAADDSLDVFDNVSDVGNASGSVDFVHPTNGVPLPLFPGTQTGPFWGETPWGSSAWGTYVIEGPSWGETPWGYGAWGGLCDLCSVSIQTNPVHFGLAQFRVKTRDVYGDYQEGDAAVGSIMVNSTPRAPTRFTRESYTGGCQSFSFEESPQLKQ